MNLSAGDPKYVRIAIEAGRRKIVTTAEFVSLQSRVMEALVRKERREHVQEPRSVLAMQHPDHLRR